MITNEQLTEILLRSGVDLEARKIDFTQSFSEMGLDSLDMYNFLTQIDDELDIDVPDEVFDQLDTMEKLRTYIEDKMNE